MDSADTSDQALVLLSTKLQSPRQANPAPCDLLQTVRWADELGRLSEVRLRAAVHDARINGVSWQSIGDVFEISRQAAFKKFSAMHDESKEYLDMTQPTTDLVDRTESVFRSLNEGDFGAVKSLMTYTCSRSLTKKKVMGMWDTMVQSTGRLESISNTVLQSADGRDTFERLANRHLLIGVVGQAELHHEAGEWIGRVAYSERGKITALLVAPAGSENLAI
jgi:hypothetical protein